MGDSLELLWWIALLIVTYVFCKLIQLIFGLIRRIYYIGKYGTLYYYYKVRGVFSPEKDEGPLSEFNFTAESAGGTYLGRLFLTPESAISRPIREEGGIITIAVDSTPDRCGGLLILPKLKCIYFYSLEWPRCLIFREQPDKFEMLNAYLALLIFDKMMATYRKKYKLRSDMLVLKCDNNFCANPETVYSGKKNARWRELFEIVHGKLRGEPFSGKWVHERVADAAILMADKLSRFDYSTYSRLPIIRITDSGLPHSSRVSQNEEDDVGTFYPGYSNKNVSMSRSVAEGISIIAYKVACLELAETCGM